MKLVNVTNSHRKLVNKQLENTDAHFVKVYSEGNTTVVYSEAEKHVEILILNQKRAIRKTETNEILKFFLRRLPKELIEKEKIETIEIKGITEISIPLSQALVRN
ncbi:DUF1827 family protein [Enterococcus sp. BWB1-3]|uniref:DUF1827 family protein n=1 Tax=unclassified Enterococcus TaxID=2608891 RepID=UPI001922C590|nr:MULTISPECIES: DUF1827 family protein [unclassified Enterococcus]MBL1229025.1 DUF1827 family protein [Enterococcus sp. BWB1-3]MCB5952294.1 DUF1827 family protein [Enterococcus sp. BWT-B8]MCB5955477.1 DUF1827 family protein [Enterococcus sp. CWB-B31]